MFFWLTKMDGFRTTSGVATLPTIRALCAVLMSITWRLPVDASV